jgi:hypothetical protein
MIHFIVRREQASTAGQSRALLFSITAEYYSALSDPRFVTLIKRRLAERLAFF